MFIYALSIYENAYVILLNKYVNLYVHLSNFYPREGHVSPPMRLQAPADQCGRLWRNSVLGVLVPRHS